MLKGIFLAFFSSIILFLSHFIVLFIHRKERRYPSPIHQLLDTARLLIVTCAGLLVFYTLLFFLISDDLFLNLIDLGSSKIFSFFYGIFLYTTLFFLYLIFYFIVDRSVSATIMIKIENSPDKRLTLEEIEKIYDIDKKYSDELEGMLQGRFILEDSGYFRNTIKGRLYARVARFLKGYFKLGPGG